MWKAVCLLLVVSFELGWAVSSDGVVDIAQRWYDEGSREESAENWSAAENAFRKYLAICHLRPDVCSAPQVEEVEQIMQALLFREKALVVSSVSNPSPLPNIKPKKSVRQPVPIQSKVNRAKTEADLVREAELAKSRGQLEQAVNLYRLAEQMIPGSQEYSVQILELEKQME